MTVTIRLIPLYGDPAGNEVIEELDVEVVPQIGDTIVLEYGAEFTRYVVEARHFYFAPGRELATFQRVSLEVVSVPRPSHLRE